MSAHLTHAMILAAGLGTRMRPLTLDKPKPLIPVGGKALIDWNIELLAEAGIENIVVNSSYLADQLEAHLAARANITISREAPPALETGGGILNALSLLGDDVFLTLNSDVLLIGENPIPTLQQAWQPDLDFLMLLVPTSQAHGRTGKGDFVLGEGGKFRWPREGEAADYIFTGVELMHPRVFTPDLAGAFGLRKLWDARLGEGGWFQRMSALVYDGTFLDVGDLAGLKMAEEFLTKQ